MNNIKKLTALSLAAVMAAACTGCGDQSWSYKTNDVSLSAGTYIYNLMNGYYTAYDMVESPDEVKKILEVEVEDSDTNEKKTVEQYAYDSADEETMKMVAVEQLFKNYGLELDQDKYESAKAYTSSIWGSMKKTFEDYGISETSFDYCYSEYTVKYTQVFEYLYGKDGEKYVDADALTSYYKDKYTGYAYFSLSMTDYDSEGNSTTKTEEEIKKAASDFEKYVKMINNDKKSYKDAVAQYISDYSLSSDPTFSGSYNKEESNLAEEVSASLDKLKEGQAEFVKAGEGEGAIYYVVYKPVTDSILDFLEEDSDDEDDEIAVETSDEAAEEVKIYDLKSGYSRYSILQEMKGDEYSDYLVDYAKSLNVEKNNAVVGKFNPKMFVKDSDD
ncbi:MAG: hypothetical protein II685_01720 [Clostridia bacterium]|nr:hypothetical protein [Clostridia bacterium]